MTKNRQNGSLRLPRRQLPDRAARPGPAEGPVIRSEQGLCFGLAPFRVPLVKRVQRPAVMLQFIKSIDGMACGQRLRDLRLRRSEGIVLVFMPSRQQRMQRQHVPVGEVRDVHFVLRPVARAGQQDQIAGVRVGMDIPRFLLERTGVGPAMRGDARLHIQRRVQRDPDADQPVDQQPAAPRPVVGEGQAPSRTLMGTKTGTQKTK